MVYYGRDNKIEINTYEFSLIINYNFSEVEKCSYNNFNKSITLRTSLFEIILK